MVLNAESADKVVVVTRTSGSQVDINGISLFLVDLDSEELREIISLPSMD